MEVSAPPGTVIGSIKYKWSCCDGSYHVKDTSGETIFEIKKHSTSNNDCNCCVLFSHESDVIYDVIDRKFIHIIIDYISNTI